MTQTSSSSSSLRGTAALLLKVLPHNSIIKATNEQAEIEGMNFYI